MAKKTHENCFNCGYKYPVHGTAELKALTGGKAVCIPCLVYYLENKRWPNVDEKKAYWTDAKIHEVLENIK